MQNSKKNRGPCWPCGCQHVMCKYKMCSTIQSTSLFPLKTPSLNNPDPGVQNGESGLAMWKTTRFCKKNVFLGWDNPGCPIL